MSGCGAGCGDGDVVTIPAGPVPFWFSSFNLLKNFVLKVSVPDSPRTSFSFHLMNWQVTRNFRV